MNLFFAGVTVGFGLGVLLSMVVVLVLSIRSASRTAIEMDHGQPEEREPPEFGKKWTPQPHITLTTERTRQ